MVAVSYRPRFLQPRESSDWGMTSDQGSVFYKGQHLLDRDSYAVDYFHKRTSYAEHHACLKRSKVIG